MSDFKKETGSSAAGVKWYLGYLKGGLVTKDAVKKVQHTPKVSTTEPKKRETMMINTKGGGG